MLAQELELTCNIHMCCLRLGLNEPASIDDLSGALEQQLGCSHCAAFFAFKNSSMASMLLSSNMLFAQGSTGLLGQPPKNTDSSLHAVGRVRSRRM